MSKKVETLRLELLRASSKLDREVRVLCSYLPGEITEDLDITWSSNESVKSNLLGFSPVMSRPSSNKPTWSCEDSESRVAHLQGEAVESMEAEANSGQLVPNRSSRRHRNGANDPFLIYQMLQLPL